MSNGHGENNPNSDRPMLPAIGENSNYNAPVIINQGNGPQVVTINQCSNAMHRPREPPHNNERQNDFPSELNIQPSEFDNLSEASGSSVKAQPSRQYHDQRTAAGNFGKY